ncbi:nucleotidyl transferase AbiEii/AbiGii toxin family protein [Caenimonas sp. SL110]|uniref:nucleotidyl transferase AbiEii/AbiGii toxin family protein n=1 Tax=Caenimonas sp. SL110 TaxID=1450524 RepID=UPI00065333AF|nr:nucleotidyl transferase AbiEii/AbiGii toxin family protein [Caenimonas sp. SL110]
MFERQHHQAIALVLYALDGALLAAHRCWFGGGTAIVLKSHEFRESVDLDFMVCDLAAYRELRQRLTTERGISVLQREGAQPLRQVREVRADQYGIRTTVSGANKDIKFEIFFEARIAFETPGPADQICGVHTLGAVDLAASKLLANSDRWADDSVHSRDLIDLAMLNPGADVLRAAMQKAKGAYGDAVPRDLGRAIDKLQERTGRLEVCMHQLKMTAPTVTVWRRIRALRKLAQLA